MWGPAAAADADTVHQILSQAADPDYARTGDAWTALMVGASRGHFEVVRLLCEAGANKDQASVLDETALHVAVQGSHPEIVALLCHAGAAINTRTMYGAPPLWLAAFWG